MEQADRIIMVYIMVDEVYKKLTQDRPLRRGGFPPKLSDPELLTIEIIGELEGKNGDRAIWSYIDRHWRSWFPDLPNYKTFAKQCANLCWMKQAMMKYLFPANDNVDIIDGVPMPVCHNVRAYRLRMLDTYTAWGFCAAKNEHYYGLRGHMVINKNGFITDCIITPANVDERLSLGDLIGHIKGMLIGDKGFIDQTWNTTLAEQGINLQTPLRGNMTDSRPKWLVKSFMKIRKSIETTFSILNDVFSFTRIKAHDLWHFTSKLSRKLLAFNFTLLLNKMG